MAANCELQFLRHEQDGQAVFLAKPRTRVAAIIDSLAAARPFVDMPWVALRESTMELLWSELHHCDPQTASFVWQQMHMAAQHDEGARLSVVAADGIAFQLLIDTTPEPPHAP